MWSVPTTVVDDSSTSTQNSFCKDGRKISVGDCALFKPPQDYPPFIGIIRRITASKESNNSKIKLGVNWLYRPSEVKLGKGILLEAAPNEVFYSFHKDEILAASLLHPCKVSFLPKGVELPSGTSSFVCRRVYDIANKCLWWLTDQDYIDVRQEEVNQLLQKTHIEMHANVPPGGRSPKPANGPATSAQIKPGSDNNLQNSSLSFASQLKGKKRDRGDQTSEPVKRERSSKPDDETNLKSEISKITEKGGLVDIEGVEKLVQLMQPEKPERKIDLISRSMLAGVIAATDKSDLLTRFVNLKGLSVLDEWLQDVNKGKIEDDKSAEDFLVVLLRALDKIPINLHALQISNIGKSVNHLHLRSHKNLEIQKKSRSLVDMWKKRVGAEMGSNDAKSGSSQSVQWPGRPRIETKSSVTQLSATKNTSVTAKSVSPSAGPMKSVQSPSSKPVVGGAHDFPQTAARDDKSSSSSQSHNNSQSCSSDHKSVSNKISTGASRHRKSVINGVQRESGTSRSPSLNKSTSLDVPASEGNSHKLIVKIPNRGRSPAQSVSGGSMEDPSIMNSRASSPVISEKNDHFDSSISKERNDVNAESWQSNDFKDEGDGSPAAIIDASKASASSIGKSNDASFSSMNALVESCVKYSETTTNASVSAGDDVGMNLLASVAAGEMTKSEMVSLTDSPQTNLPSGNGDDNHQSAAVANGGPGPGKRGIQAPSKPAVDDRKSNSSICEEKLAEDLQQPEDPSSVYNANSDETIDPNGSTGENANVQGDKHIHVDDAKPRFEDKVTSTSSTEENIRENVEGLSLSSVPVPGIDGENNNHKMKEESSIAVQTEQKPPPDLVNKNDEVPEIVNEEKAEQTNGNNHSHTEKQSVESDKNASLTDRRSDNVEDNSESNKDMIKQQSDEAVKHKDKDLPAAEETDECASTTSKGGSDVEAKVEFDLNEGFNSDEGPVNLLGSAVSAPSQLISLLPFPVSSVSTALPASITVAAAAKGPFVPPKDLLKNKGEIGWRGSAATSAFRPAEPRKVLEMPLAATTSPIPNLTSPRQNRPILNIDLNEPDDDSEPIENHDNQGVFAPVRCSIGLDLDLNRVDETATDNGPVSIPSVRSSFVNGDIGVRRNFDLNNGPVFDEVAAEPFPFNSHVRASVMPLSQPPSACLRMNNAAELGNFPSWIQTGNTFSAVTLPSILPDRGQRIGGAAPSTAGTQLTSSDIYRGGPAPVLSSSPAVHFPSTQFQYPVFPFGPSFPLPSTAYTDTPSGGRFCFPAGAVSSNNYPRPYVALTDANVNGKWGRQGFDLNAGPGSLDIEGRDESSMVIASRQFSVASSSHATLAEEQARMFQVAAGGVVKRKEPDGGWDTDGISYKHSSSWQ